MIAGEVGKPSMTRLEELVGTLISAVIPNMQKEGEADHFQEFTLHGIEPGSGIWIESQRVNDDALEFTSLSSAPKTLIMFVPFQHVKSILDSLDVPSLSEKSLLE